MKEIKWRATPKSLAAINFVPCETCIDDCKISFYEGDSSELCALCPKSNSKYAQEYRKHKEDSKQERFQKYRDSIPKAETDLTENSMEEMIKHIRTAKRYENGNIPINISIPTYILDDGDINLLKIGAERNGKNLYDYLNFMVGKEAKVITSCKSALILNKAKLERASSKGENYGRD